VAIEGADITNAKGLEKCRRLNDFSYRRINTLQARIGKVAYAGEFADCTFDAAPGGTDTGVQPYPGEALGKPRDGRGVGAPVVVQYHDYP
jgi:hypothetical protein